MEAQNGSESVCVAVHVRPLIGEELEQGCRPCLAVVPGEPQVAAGEHSFRYDHVFGDYGQPPAALYDTCVQPLVDGLFKGYNATVFAYGQTGSGKTYTMGSAFTPGGAPAGVIPSVMEAIFERVARMRDVDFTVRVGFVEIHKDDIRDLIVSDATPQTQVHIREVPGGSICLAGANEREVRNKEQMEEILQQGTLLRATAATGMNKRSSRSHAIFTITLEQRKLLPQACTAAGGAAGGGGQGGGEDSGDEEEGESDAEQDDGADDSYLCAKMHLVDLAGSERAKRTKAVGQRLQEGININKGLLALGNVICALSEGKQHVPYRDSKLTRMLQDSLGGNSRTVMIACVSPADVNMEETLNTLRYASRARNIRNKPVVNRDPVAAQIAHLRQQLAAVKAENQSLKRKLGISETGEGLFDGGRQDLVMEAALEELEARNRRLEMECNRLRVEGESLQHDLTETTEKMIVAQAQRDKLTQKLEQVDPHAAEEAKATLGLLAGEEGRADETMTHLQRIVELEREVKRLRQVSRVSGAFVVNSRRQSLALDAAVPGSPFGLTDTPDDCLSDLELNDDEFAAEEQAHRHEMTRVQAKISLLQQQLEEKEARMQVVGGHALMKQAYDRQLRELQEEVGVLQKERIKLVQELQSLQHAGEEERLRLEVQYKSRLKEMDDKLKSLRGKEKRIMELERIKGKAEEACKRLQADIQNIKQQKVALIKQAEKASKEFAEFRRQRDKELVQLRKQGRANAAQLHKMEALHQKQQAVLRRKTEEAEAARKRLKELEQRRSQAVSRPGTAATAAPADRPTTAPAAAPAAPAARPPPAMERSISVPGAPTSVDCQPNQMAPLLRDEKSRREWVERELDTCCASYDLQRVLEGEKALRSECARKLREVEKKMAALKNPGWWPVSASPGSQTEQQLLRQKQELHRQLDAHSKQIQECQLALMKAKQSEEEKGGGAADARRWNGLRTIVEARAMLKTVFRCASQHKAQAYEAQVQVTEAVEEVELLRLRLDISEQEKLEASNLAAKAQAAAAAIAASAPAPLPEAAPAQSKDDTDTLAEQVIEQLGALAPPNLLLESIPEEVGGGGGSECEDEGYSEESEDELSSDEEEPEAWDPSQATPFVKRKKALAAAQHAERERRSSTGAASSRGSAGAFSCPEEQPVLNYINEERRKGGEEPVAKLTVPILKQHLKGKLIGGQEWRAGSKKRDDLIADFREYLGLRAVEPTSPASSLAVSLSSWSIKAAPQSAEASLPPGEAQDTPPLDPRPVSTTPLGAQGATPDTLPTMRQPAGLGASPPSTAGLLASGGSVSARPALSVDVGEPGSPHPAKSSSSSPMQRLLALNPFASRHGRSRSELPAASAAWPAGAPAPAGPHSQPATPSSGMSNAAALLERSAACMQRAADIRGKVESTLKTHPSRSLTSAASGAAALTPPSAEGLGGAGAGAAAAAPGPAAGQPPGSGASSGCASPSRLLGWFKQRGNTPKEGSVGAAGAVDIVASSGRGVTPLGASNGHPAPAAPAVGSESEERENLLLSAAPGNSAAARGPAIAATAAAGGKQQVPKLSAAALSRAGSASERQPASASSSPSKVPRSQPNSARAGSPLRVWK